MIIISPYAKKLISGKQNPKNYPFWKELIKMIDEPIVQVGIRGKSNLSPISARTCRRLNFDLWSGTATHGSHATASSSTLRGMRASGGSFCGRCLIL